MNSSKVPKLGSHQLDYAKCFRVAAQLSAKPLATILSE